MGNLINHPGMTLRDDAAQAINDFERDHNKLTITSAGRSEDEQQHLITRWDQGGPSNRPPFLYEPARPARTSRHVIDGGIAVDVVDWRRFKPYAVNYGFVWWGEDDPVHFEFIGRETNEEEEEMQGQIYNIQGQANKRRGGSYVLKDGKLHYLGAYVDGVPIIKYDEGSTLIKLFPLA